MTYALKKGDIKRKKNVKRETKNNNSKKCEHAMSLNCALER